MKPQGPCKDCQDRFLGCHDRCEKFKAFKLRLEEYNKMEKLESMKHVKSDYQNRMERNRLLRYRV